jgi:hypothetical protein
MVELVAAVAVFVFVYVVFLGAALVRHVVFYVMFLHHGRSVLQMSHWPYVLAFYKLGLRAKLGVASLTQNQPKFVVLSSSLLFFSKVFLIFGVIVFDELSLAVDKHGVADDVGISRLGLVLVKFLLAYQIETALIQFKDFEHIV